MPHPLDTKCAETLPNGWVMLEKGEAIPDERLYHHRNPSGRWTLAEQPVNPRDQRYGPSVHRALARRMDPSEREW